MRIPLLIAVCLILYGFLCRLINIYFFWESRTLGWLTLLIFSIIILGKIIVDKKKSKEKKLIEGIVLGILALILITQLILLVVLPRSDAYDAAKEYLLKNKEIQIISGGITDFTVLPVGMISVSSTDNVDQGNAELNIIVKGKNKYIDLHVIMLKDNTSKWKVVDIK